MHDRILLPALVVLLLAFTGCAPADQAPADDHHAAGEEVRKGPHGGRLLTSDGFTLELAIFETGVPPEFRVWATADGDPVPPAKVDLRITLGRLGGDDDVIRFRPADGFLRGDTVVREPHSFTVTVEVSHMGTQHRWEYDNVEGRTRIDAATAAAFGLTTEEAGPATIEETLTLFGRIVASPGANRVLRARFDGMITDVHAAPGDQVRQGQPLVTVQSDASLRPYTIASPIDGVVAARQAHPGEYTAGRDLLSITDPTRVQAELAVFPGQRQRIRVGLPVRVYAVGEDRPYTGTIERVDTRAGPNQAVAAWVALDDGEAVPVAGLQVRAEVRVAEHRVPLAVHRRGLQAFRDFTVVYAQVGDQYEVRMLDLGRQDGDRVEVLGGLDAGTRYVVDNSYLIKADIEKSGASHDH